MKGFGEMFTMQKGKMADGETGYIGVTANFAYEICGDNKSDITSMGFLMREEVDDSSNQEINRAVLIQFLINAFPEKEERQIAGELVEKYFADKAGEKIDEIVNGKHFECYMGAGEKEGFLIMNVSRRR